MAEPTGRLLERFDPRVWAETTAKSGRTRWRDCARPEQLPPQGDWKVWLILAGRGWGKTRTGSETTAEWARTYPGCRIALVARTFADGRDVMVEGVSGLLSVLDPSELRGGSIDSAWNRSLGELYLANGTRFKVYSSEKPDQLRGPANHFAWGDETAMWLDAHKGIGKHTNTTWSNLMLNVREKGREGWPDGYRTRVIVTTTPRPVALLRVAPSELKANPHTAGITQLPDAAITRGRTQENLSNLADEYRALVEDLAGTSLGRQELDAEILDDVEGALLPRALIETLHVTDSDVRIPVLSGIRVIGVDPAVTANEDSDETGITVVARGSDGVIYVLADHSFKGSPTEWTSVVWAAAVYYGAAAVVVEDNQGGDHIENSLLTTWSGFVHSYARSDIDLGRWLGDSTMGGGDSSRGVSVWRSELPAMPPIYRVHPSGPNSGKWLRAQTTRLLYEKGRVKHVVPGNDPAHFQRLEDALCTWTGQRGEKSPDRIDALVHAIDFLQFPDIRTGSRYKNRSHAPRRIRSDYMR